MNSNKFLANIQEEMNISTASIIAIFNTPKLLVIGSGFATSVTLISVKYLPSTSIFFWLVVAVAGDLFTGLLKAWARGENTSSEGFRKTVIKIGSYVGTIVMVVILVNMLSLMDKDSTYNLALLIDWLVGFIVFIELYSICENISITYPESLLVKWLVAPIMTFLKGRLSKSPTEPIDKPQQNEPS